MARYTCSLFKVEHRRSLGRFPEDRNLPARMLILFDTQHANMARYPIVGRRRVVLRADRYHKQVCGFRALMLSMLFILTVVLMSDQLWQ